MLQSTAIDGTTRIIIAYKRNRESSSLLLTDKNPAVLWVTNLQAFDLARQHEHLTKCGCLKEFMSTLPEINYNHAKDKRRLPPPGSILHRSGSLWFLTVGVVD
jgi:hypothetical protein